MKQSFTVNKYIDVSLGDIKAKIFLAKVKDILPIYYVAVRGKNDEDGAVQRVLNKRRISSIKDFVLNGDMFFNTFILNWVDQAHPIIEQKEEQKLIVPIVPSGAQVIDGQHRLAGIKQACDERSEIGNKMIIVLLTENLSTQDAAKIFLNINTEQKPVPTSLVFDLFGEVKDKDYFIVRAKDIAKQLNNDAESPYYNCIRMPGTNIKTSGIGRVDLSAAVNILKQFTAENGLFNEYNIPDFESQYKIIFNFLSVLRNFYDKEDGWVHSNNPFITNAGCYASIDFLCRELLPKCAAEKSFEQSTMQRLIPLDKIGLIYKDDIKNKQGNAQRKIIYDSLKTALLHDIPAQDEYRF